MKLVQRNREGRFAIIWRDTSDITGEHFCHVHPLGSTEVTRYWCGDTCKDPVCRKYMAVWLLTHPLQLIRHLRRLDYRGRRR